MPTYKTMEECWQTKTPAILSHPILIAAATEVAALLTNLIGLDVAVVMSEAIPATNKVYVFDPGHVLPLDAVTHVLNLADFWEKQHGETGIREHDTREAEGDR